MFAFRCRVGERPVQGVLEIQLPIDDVRPGRGQGILQVCQPYIGSGVQRIDGHLAVHRTGDFNPAIREPRRHGRDLPCGILADVAGFRKESGIASTRDEGPLFSAAGKQLLPAGFGVLVERANEVERLTGQDLVLAANRRGGERNSVQGRKTVHGGCSFCAGDAVVADTNLAAGCKGRARHHVGVV